MDHSWCPICERHIFATENLYCSERCRRKDAASRTATEPSLLVQDSSPDQYPLYGFPRRQSPRLTPLSLSLSPESEQQSYFGDHEYSSPLSSSPASPSTFLYASSHRDGSELLSVSPSNFTLGLPYFSLEGGNTSSQSTGTWTIRKKRSFTDNARRLFFF